MARDSFVLPSRPPPPRQSPPTTLRLPAPLLPLPPSPPLSRAFRKLRLSLDRFSSLSARLFRFLVLPYPALLRALPAPFSPPHLLVHALTFSFLPVRVRCVVQLGPTCPGGPQRGEREWMGIEGIRARGGRMDCAGCPSPNRRTDPTPSNLRMPIFGKIASSLDRMKADYSCSEKGEDNPPFLRA
jgi:hypothetical protein